MNNNTEELRVKTSIGDLVAYKSTDPENPGIFLMFRPEGETIEIDLLYAEVPKEIDEKPNNDILCAYTYENVWTEDYTRKFQISRTEALSAIDSCN